MAGSLLAAGLASGSSESWIQAVLPDPAEPGWGSLWTCDSMASAQESLSTVRTARKAVIDSGRAARARCRVSDSICAASLAPLRDWATRLGTTEDSLRTSLARLASGCPAAGWERRIQRRSWLGGLDSTSPADSLPARSRLRLLLARSSWKAAWISGTGDTTAVREIDDALASVPTSRQELLLRKALLLRRSGSPGTARALLETLCDSFPDTRTSQAAHLLLGEDSALPRESRMVHLGKARRDPIFLDTALAGQVRLLEQAGKPGPAADSLLLRLVASSDPVDSSDLRHLADLASRAGIPPDSLQAKLGSPAPDWADTLFLLQAQQALRDGKPDLARSMLARFQLRFPGTRLGPVAREWLAIAREVTATRPRHPLE